MVLDECECADGRDGGERPGFVLEERQSSALIGRARTTQFDFSQPIGQRLPPNNKLTGKDVRKFTTKTRNDQKTHFFTLEDENE